MVAPRPDFLGGRLHEGGPGLRRRGEGRLGLVRQQGDAPFPLGARGGEGHQVRAPGRRRRRVPQLPARGGGDGGGGGPRPVGLPGGLSVDIGTKAELEALRPAADLRNELGRTRATYFLGALEALVAATAGVYSVEVVLAKGKEGTTVKGANSALGRGAQVRVALDFRIASPRAMGGGPETDVDRGAQPGSLGDGPAPPDGPVPPPGSQDQSAPGLAQVDPWAPPAAVAGQTLMGVSGVLC